MTVLTREVLSSIFFDRPVLTVAREMLGKYLVTEREARMITEVEAYDGPKDLACHGRFGETARTAVMFGPAGHFYVYFVYGVHWMLNVVTGPRGYPAAVLIRGVEGLRGPGKLTKELGIDRRFNGRAVAQTSGLWIEDRGVVVPRSAVARAPRIGVDYAGSWARKPYRFILEAPRLSL